MKLLFVNVLSLLIIPSSSLAHGKSRTEKTEFFKGTDSAPAKVVERFHRALKGKNKKAAMKQLDDSVLIYEEGGVERSAKEYASHHLISDMTFMSKMKVKLIEHQVEVFGNLAVSSSRSKIDGDYNKKKINKTTMETIVLKKHKDKWKIIRIHWS